MIDILFSSVLPFFSVVAIGFVVGRAGVFDDAEAAALNRFVFLIALPVLGFRLLATADFGRFDWSALAAYAGVELAVYAAGFTLARRIFGRGVRESLLIGMACIFSNQVFLVLPIAVAVIGEDAAMPITGVITVDLLLFYVGTMLLLEAIGEGGAAAGATRLGRNLVRNPQILAVIAGMSVSLAGVSLAPGIDLFTGFVAATAAPVSLFALGIVLAGLEGRGDYVVAAAITAAKLVVVPALVATLFLRLLSVAPAWQSPLLMVAAGPVGAMPFVLAIQYKVPPGAVAGALVLSTIAALFTVTYAVSLAV